MSIIFPPPNNVVIIKSLRFIWSIELEIQTIKLMFYSYMNTCFTLAFIWWLESQVHLELFYDSYPCPCFHITVITTKLLHSPHHCSIASSWWELGEASNKQLDLKRSDPILYLKWIFDQFRTVSSKALEKVLYALKHFLEIKSEELRWSWISLR